MVTENYPEENGPRLDRFINRNRKHLPFLLGLAGALLFAFLPVLIHGYTYPPCQQLSGPNETIRQCDPKGLDTRLDFRLQGYYGHLPAAVLGMHLYYRLVPVFIFLGVWALLQRYGWLAPLLACVALFFISRAIAFDLRNGTFVGLINFYLWGFLLIHTVEKWAEGESHGISRWLIPLTLAMGMVFFHAFTGLVTFAGAMFHWSAFRKPPFAFVALLLGVAVFISLTFLPSSITRAREIPGMTATLLSSHSHTILAQLLPLFNEPKETKNQAIIAGKVEYPRMSLYRFSREYVGEGTLLFWLLALIVGYFAHRRGWRPKWDTSMGMHALTTLPLIIMTFGIFALNADRTAKLLIGITVVLAATAIVRGLQYLGHPKLYWASGGMVALALVYEAPQIIPYWLAMGSYE